MATFPNVSSLASLNLPASTIAELAQLNPNLVTLDPNLLANLPAGAPALRVRPGDIISSELINLILARLEALEAASVTGLALGPLAADTHTLVALGTGFESGGGIFLDGQSLLTSQVSRGINLVILDPNLTVKFRASYDTFGAASESTRLAADLQSQAAPQDLVIGVTHDAYAAQLQANARAALAAVGGAALGLSERLRDNAAFIGIVPTNRATSFYNHLVSFMPADADGFTSARLAAQPFVWGVYSRPQRRFLLGGGSDVSAPKAMPTINPTLPTLPTLTATINPTLTAFPTFTVFPTLTATINPTLTATINPTLTLINPTLTAINPTLTAINPTLINPQPFVFQPLRPEESVRALPGVGRAEHESLANAGIANIGALAEAQPSRVAEVLNLQPDAAAQLIGNARLMLGPR